MLKIAQLVPRHPGRTGKAKAQPESNPAGAAGSSSSGATKKSGKKKR